MSESWATGMVLYVCSVRMVHALQLLVAQMCTEPHPPARGPQHWRCCTAPPVDCRARARPRSRALRVPVDPSTRAQNVVRVLVSWNSDSVAPCVLSLGP